MNAELAKARSRRYRAKNSKKLNQKSVDWQRSNKEKVAVIRAKSNRKHSDTVRSRNAAYRAQKLKAMPSWVDRNELDKFYSEAKRLTEETGIQHHVDHIDPLNGKNISGLHVPANLQVIPKMENLRKGNRHASDI